MGAGGPGGLPITGEFFISGGEGFLGPEETYPRGAGPKGSSGRYRCMGCLPGRLARRKPPLQTPTVRYPGREIKTKTLEGCPVEVLAYGLWGGHLPIISESHSKPPTGRGTQNKLPL